MCVSIKVHTSQLPRGASPYLSPHMTYCTHTHTHTYIEFKWWCNVDGSFCQYKRGRWCSKGAGADKAPFAKHRYSSVGREAPCGRACCLTKKLSDPKSRVTVNDNTCDTADAFSVSTSSTWPDYHDRFASHTYICTSFSTSLFSVTYIFTQLNILVYRTQQLA